MKLATRWAGICAVALAVMGTSARVWAQGEQSEALEQARYEKITEFLLGEYARIGQSSDWFTRSLAAISVSRLPQSRANRALIKIVKEDAAPAVALVAWECLLARAKTIDPEQFDAWIQATPKLVEKNAFNGRLRADLLKVLAIYPPDTAAKKTFVKIFEETSSLRPQDMPVIEQLGHTLAAWRSPELAKGLVEKMKNLNDAYRAELVLKIAGCPVAWAGNKSDEGSGPMWDAAKKEYVNWFKDDKDNWKEMTAKPEGAPWRELSSGLLTISMFDQDAVKANNPEVRRDLELGNPGLRAFDVMFVVDATESMQPPMDWLRDDLRKMMEVMGMMSSQPRIGITFYRDYFGKTKTPGKYVFVAKTHPLTKNVDSLIKALADTPALGGGDDPEAVKEGLQDCFKKGGWDVASHTGMVDMTATPEEKAAAAAAATQPARPGDAAVDPKVVILIGDAPPHPGTEGDCLSMVKQAVEKGFKVYAVKLTTPLGEDKGVLPSFDQIAAAGKGASFSANFAEHQFEFRGTAPEKKGNIRHVWTAKLVDQTGPSKELLTKILVDSVNVKYKERIETVVPLLLEMCEKPVPEVRAQFDPAKEAPKPTTGPGPKEEKKPAPKRHQQ